MTIYRYKAVRARQASGHDVFVFAAPSRDVLNFAAIERVGRRDDGQLKGFQRHQIASHIKEIRDYLARDDALLPNAVIVAFIDSVKVKDRGHGVVDVEIDASEGKLGFVVDGQQRLTALSGIDKPGFEVFVSALVCKDYNELRQQFVLINNTRPLPKSLIYELRSQIVEAFKCAIVFYRLQHVQQSKSNTLVFMILTSFKEFLSLARFDHQCDKHKCCRAQL